MKEKQKTNVRPEEARAAVPERNPAFELSLLNMTVADAAPEYAAAHPECMEPKKKSRVDPTTVIRAVMIVLCVGLFAFSAYQLVLIFIGYSNADEMYGDLHEEFERLLSADENGVMAPMARSGSDRPLKPYGQKDDPSDTEPVHETSLRFQRLRVYLNSLTGKNPDTYGHISVTDTNIAYPIVQSEDNKFYLTHGFDGSPLKAGAIFVDFRNSRKIEENRNIVIYGHNMQNGAMFHDLLNFLDEDFFMSNDVEITTADGIYTFRVFSIYEVSKFEPYYMTFFYTDEDFLEFAETAEKNSKYHKDVSFSTDDILLTLSTCVTGNTSIRYAIHAVLIGVET